MSVARRYRSINARRAIVGGNDPVWLLKHPRQSYLRAAYLSLPEWQCRKELDWIDWCRRSWSVVMGEEYVLDHQIPLNHPSVCGLSVVANFALLPRVVNGAKGAKWNEGQAVLW